MIESAREHLTLLDLPRRRDAAAAKELMERHIARAGSFWNKRNGT